MSCAPAPQQASSEVSSTQPRPRQTLVVSHRYEYTYLAPKIQQLNGPLNTTRLFNAALSLIDDKGVPRPYLAESLPQLNTDAWRIFPDGRMETTYRLRENLTWQDGAPLTADDFAFAFRVYKESGLPGFIASPQDVVDSVAAPDPRTLVVAWKSPNAGGGSLGFEELDPLPRHLLEALLSGYSEGRTTAEGVLGNPLWSTEYVGAGPFRLERWDPGVQLEGTAFDGHSLGRPKIDRLVVRIIIDENTTLTRILAGGQLDYACCNTLRFEQYATLKREWEPAGKGTAVFTPGPAVYLVLQQRPEYVGHEGLLDVRVRRALAHAIDRQALNEGVFNGLGVPTDNPVPANVPFYAEAERLLRKYPLDLNRSTQLMSEAGFTRDPQGFFADRQGARFYLDFAVQGASEIERMQTILADLWRRAGFDVRTVVFDPRVFAQAETRATLPGLGYSFYLSERAYTSSEVPTAANRWSGRNRSGWTSPEYDRLYGAWNTTLDPAQRGSYAAQMVALVNENLPGYPLYFSATISSWVASLQGPTNATNSSGFGETARATTDYWNVYDWTMGASR